MTVAVKVHRSAFPIRKEQPSRSIQPQLRGDRRWLDECEHYVPAILDSEQHGFEPSTGDG